MKKFVALFGIIFLLTSCEAHVGDNEFYIPWQALMLFDVVIILAALALAHIYIITRHFKCPRCGTVFRPKWYEISSWLHLGSSRLVKCPHCHYRGFCEKE